MIARALVLALMLAGCASAPPLSSTRQQAVQASQRGLSALARGDAAQAADAFEHALLLERSIEREAGIATAAHNLAIAYQRMGRGDAAGQVIDSILLDGLRTYPDGTVAALALRKATLQVAAGRLEDASIALDRAEATCAGRCALRASLHNLRAHLALLAGDAPAALAQLEHARRAGRVDEAERANTHRLRASALLALGDAAAAYEQARLALAIDKALGRAEPIRQDLLLLAASSADPAQQQAYRERARAVDEAASRTRPGPPPAAGAAIPKTEPAGDRP